MNASELRAEASRHEAAAQESFDRCDTDESFKAMEGVEELTGWLANRSHMTHEELAKGILALSAEGE